MENKKSNNTLITVAWIVLILCVIVLTAMLATGVLKFNVPSNNTNNQTSNNGENTNNNTEVNSNERIETSALYGTYTWNKKYTNENGNELNLKVTLVLNSDGTATYNASDGYSYEATKGSYKYENNQIIYTREYYNYDNQENDRYTENNKTEIFNVINANTLQNTYHNQQTELTK